MKKTILGAAVAAVIGVGLIVGGAGIANAQGGQKKVVVKSAPKVVVVKSGPRHHSNRNRNVGLGIAAVVGTAIAIEAARANSGERRYYRGGEGLSCPALERRCDDGQNWACRRLGERPDC